MFTIYDGRLAGSAALPIQHAAGWGIYPPLLHAEITHFYRDAGTADIAMMAGAVDATGGAFPKAGRAGSGDAAPVLIQSPKDDRRLIIPGRLGPASGLHRDGQPPITTRLEAAEAVLSCEELLFVRPCLLPVHGHVESAMLAEPDGCGRNIRFTAGHRDGGIMFVAVLADMAENADGSPSVVAFTRRCKDRARGPAGRMPLFVRGAASIKAWLDPFGLSADGLRKLLMTLHACDLDRRIEGAGPAGAFTAGRLNA